MSAPIKNLDAILKKLGIRELNAMQKEAYEVILENPETIILSPTGTGKTLAFLLPLLEDLDRTDDELQAMILVPSRELAMQIEQVAREIGSGYKINAVYGGRSGSKDKAELKHSPALLIGTPGRVADHIRRENIYTKNVHTLILDEFDKSLETGFENEMREIMDALPMLKRKVLTSATQKVEIPAFTRIKNPMKLDYLSEGVARLKVEVVVSHSKNKLIMLERLLGYLGDKNGIVFCSLKDTILEVSDDLQRKNIGHTSFYGGLEQIDRERALMKFRNGTERILVSSDLAARGIDVPELDYIIHFEIPEKADEFTHRNGRTARMNRNGRAIVIKWENEELPEFITDYEELKIDSATEIVKSKWETLHISGGRKDKISKGDIAGLFFKQGGLKKDELGIIELKQESSFVAVPAHKAFTLIEALNNSRLKKRKVRISLVE